MPISTDELADMHVHNNFTLIKFSNDSFQAYIRPRVEGTSNLTKPRNGGLTLNPAPDNLIYRVDGGLLSGEENRLMLYAIPNWINQENFLFTYNVT